MGRVVNEARLGIDVLFDGHDAHSLPDPVVEELRKEGASPVGLVHPRPEDDPASPKWTALRRSRGIHVRYVVRNDVQARPLGSKSRCRRVYAVKKSHFSSPYLKTRLMRANWLETACAMSW